MIRLYDAVAGMGRCCYARKRSASLLGLWPSFLLGKVFRVPRLSGDRGGRGGRARTRTDKMRLNKRTTRARTGAEETCREEARREEQAAKGGLRETQHWHRGSGSGRRDPRVATDLVVALSSSPSLQTHARALQAHLPSCLSPDAHTHTRAHARTRLNARKRSEPDCWVILLHCNQAELAVWWVVVAGWWEEEAMGQSRQARPICQWRSWSDLRPVRCIIRWASRWERVILGAGSGCRHRRRNPSLSRVFAFFSGLVSFLAGAAAHGSRCRYYAAGRASPRELQHTSASWLHTWK